MAKLNRLKNAHVIITGASDGIGKELTLTLVNKYDCFVLGIARNKEKLEAVKSALGDKSENFSYLSADVSDLNFWKSLSATLLQQDSVFDCLINNAGVMPPFEFVADQDEGVFERTVAVNLAGVYYATRALIPVLRKSKRASIINISSSASLCPVGGTAIYSATKAGVKAFTEALNAEEKNMLVSYVCPGFTKTNLFRDTNGFFDSKLVSAMTTPVEKMAKKIIKGIIKGKRRMIFGTDAKLMNFLHSVAPVGASPFILSILKKSGDKAFDKMFKKENKDE